MLKTLQRESRDDRRQIVARLAASLLPNPGIDEDQLSMSPEPFDAVLAEIKQELKIRSDDDSSKARLRLYHYLARLMTSLVLPTDEVSEVRARVGQRGVLPAQLYEVRFGDTFDEYATKRGVSRAMVAETLKRPDYQDHLFPSGDYTPVSLYAKTPRPSGDDPYTLLVVADRNGAMLNVSTAWRVFHSHVDLKGATTAIDVLKRMVDVYGVEFVILGVSTKLLIGEVIPFIPGPTTVIEAPGGRFALGPSALEIKIEPGLKEAYQAFTFKVDSERAALAVALAFALNVTRYDDDLRRHGLHIEGA